VTKKERKLIRSQNKHKNTQGKEKKRKEIIDQNENSVKRRKPEDIFGFSFFLTFSDQFFHVCLISSYQLIFI
jgi:hypothetical protein